MITAHELYTALRQIPDPDKHKYDMIRVLIPKKLDLNMPISPVCYIEELVFIKSLDRQEWILKEITTGGVSLTLPTTKPLPA